MHVLIVLSLALAGTAITTKKDDKNWGGLDSMNGIRLRDYPDFEKKWTLAGVRFRKDTGELRFTYANPLAWKNLKKKTSDYPDGAVFAKIGFLTGEDPAFPSSVVANGARRFQLMVRDRKKYADTGGWGYALFTSNGVTYNDNPKTSAVACHACHQLVPERNYVFTEPMLFSPSETWLAQKKPAGERLSFRDGTPKDLPARALSSLPSSTAKIRLLTGDLQKNLFEGTLNEIRPALTLEALKTGLPAALVSDDQDQFAIVFPSAKDPKACRERQAATPMTAIFTVSTPDPAQTTKLRTPRPFERDDFCWK